PRIVEPESVKVNAYIQGLIDNIKGEVTSFKPTNLNEAVRVAHKLMEKKLQDRNEMILGGNKQKWENFQSENSSGKSNNKDNSRQSSQNNQNQGNARAMTTAPNEGNVYSGSLPIIMENVISLNHVDDLPIVKPNQPDVVPIIPKPVLVDEDEDQEEEEFKEEEEPQEEEDMDIDDEEDENEPELTFHYKEADHLNPLPPASDSEPEDVIEVEDTVEPEDETISASVHGVGESSTASFHREDSDGLLPDLGNEVRSSMEEGTAAMENLVRKLGNAEEGAVYKKLEKELEEARIMSLKSAPLTQAVVRRMIRESADVVIAAKRAKQANARNNASGSGQARGQVTTLVVR
ncbi:hypothetical protein Tco_1355669, partial [Tanacetum coccineum]